MLAEVGRWSDEVGWMEGERTANQLQMSVAEREIRRVKDSERVRRDRGWVGGLRKWVRCLRRRGG